MMAQIDGILAESDRVGCPVVSRRPGGHGSVVKCVHLSGFKTVKNVKIVKNPSPVYPEAKTN
jgi:hypothetical protein